MYTLMSCTVILSAVCQMTNKDIQSVRSKKKRKKERNSDNVTMQLRIHVPDHPCS